MHLPELVIHADWSIRPQKRWLAQALRQPGAQYKVEAPELVPASEIWLPSLHQRQGNVLLGLDFPIGVPEVYARQVGVTNFLCLLPQLGRGEWADFYRVAEKPEEIGLKRPFYPQRPGSSKQQYLLAGLNVAQINELRRRCELPQPDRRAAAPLFWTMGAQQVGKAAIAGWQEVLVPALTLAHTVIWPFSGNLADLMASQQLVVAEAYPAEFYIHLDITFPANTGKRSQNGRLANASVLLEWAAQNHVNLSLELRRQIQAGFGTDATGEDKFDAVVGLFGMLNLLLGKRPLHEPTDPVIRQIEGWILGQAN